LHPKRLRQRGFNQVVELARGADLPLVHALERVRHTPPQVGQPSFRRRIANVEGAFSVRDAAAVAGKRVLLLDDVMTTGATADACAAALRQAKAWRIHFVALARA